MCAYHEIGLKLPPRDGNFIPIIPSIDGIIARNLSEKAVLTHLYSANKSHKDFQKPHKIFKNHIRFLNNTNFSYAYCQEPLIGTIRETFVVNCLSGSGALTAPTFGDFCLDDHYTFEVGGKNKNRKQLKSIKNSFVLADDVLSADKEQIPLWLLGFLW